MFLKCLKCLISLLALSGVTVTTVKCSYHALPHRVTWVTVQCLFFFTQSHFFFFLNTVNFINFSSSRSLIFKTWYIPSSGYHKLLYINLDDESFFYCWIFACKTDFASNFAKCFLSQYYCTAISEHENIYWKFVVWEVSDIWKMRSKGLGAGWKGGQG